MLYSFIFGRGAYPAVLKHNSWLYAQGSNPDQSHTRQVPYLLYCLSTMGGWFFCIISRHTMSRSLDLTLQIIEIQESILPMTKGFFGQYFELYRLGAYTRASPSKAQQCSLSALPWPPAYTGMGTLCLAHCSSRSDPPSKHKTTLDSLMTFARKHSYMPLESLRPFHTRFRELARSLPGPYFLENPWE